MIYRLGIFQEDANRGKPNWEHLADDLHVLLTVEDTENRAKIKLARAVEEVKRLLVPVSVHNIFKIPILLRRYYAFFCSLTLLVCLQ